MLHACITQVVNGSFSLSLGVDEMYTLTTKDTGRRGDGGKIPKPHAFPIPYKDNYNGNAKRLQVRFVNAFNVENSVCLGESPNHLATRNEI